MKTEKCAICGKEFEKKTNARYCSPECKGKALLENQHKFAQYVALRSAVFNDWKKQHPDLYEKEMRKLRGD